MLSKADSPSSPPSRLCPQLLLDQRSTCFFLAHYEFGVGATLGSITLLYFSPPVFSFNSDQEVLRYYFRTTKMLYRAVLQGDPLRAYIFTPSSSIEVTSDKIALTAQRKIHSWVLRSSSVGSGKGIKSGTRSVRKGKDTRGQIHPFNHSTVQRPVAMKLPPNPLI